MYFNKIRYVLYGLSCVILCCGLSIQGCGGDECQIDKDCLSRVGAGYICRIGAEKNKVCIKKVEKEKKCEPACKSGEVCKTGVCTPTEKKGCEPACEKGYTCKNRECIPDDPNVCKPACHEAFECKAGKCVIKNSQKKCEPACKAGEICDHGKCIPKPCQPACSPGEVCKNGVCLDPNAPSCAATCKKCVKGICQDITKEYLARCGAGGTRCPDNYLCLQQISHLTSKPAYCVLRCNVKDPYCPNGGECRAASGGSGYCTPTGNLKEGQTCFYDKVTDKFDPGQFCAKGMRCFAFSGTARTCMRVKDGSCTTNAGFCPAVDVCRTFGSATTKQQYAFCFTRCKNNVCPLGLKNMTCRTSGNETYCFPVKQ